MDVKAQPPSGARQSGTAAPRGRPAAPAVEHDIHVLDRLNVLFKYRYVALSVFALVILGSLLRTYTTTPLYRAQARLLIEVEDERTAAMVGTINRGRTIPSGSTLYNTQFRIHRARARPTRGEGLNLGTMPSSMAGPPRRRWPSNASCDRS